MGLDLKDSLTFATEYLGRYFGDLIDVLSRPTIVFAPTFRSISTSIQGPSESSLVREQFNPSLLGFAAISFLVGFALQSFAGGVAKDQNPLVYGGSVLVVWFALGALSAVTSRVLGGNRSVVETVSYVIQVLAACFVVSSGAFLLWHLVPAGLRPRVTGVANLDESLTYLALQFTLVVGYLAVGTARLQRFGWIKTSIQTISLASALLLINLGASMIGRPPLANPPPGLGANCGESVASALETFGKSRGLDVARSADGDGLVALISPRASSGATGAIESRAEAFARECMLFGRVYADNQPLKIALRGYLVKIKLDYRSVKEGEMLALGFTPDDVSHLAEHLQQALAQSPPTWSIAIEFQPVIGLSARINSPTPDAEATLAALQPVQVLAARCVAASASAGVTQ